jgi:cell division protease FtsH
MQYLNSAQTLEERNFSDATAQSIDAEVKALLEEGRERAHEILTRCREVHARLSAELEEKETLDAEDVLRLAQECHQGPPQRDGG